MKPIPGFEGRYSACDDGRIYSHVSQRHLKSSPVPGRNGRYLRVQLGRGCYRTVHSLILLAFVGPRPPGLEARHLDGNGHNNVPGNLAWGTRPENVVDKLVHGTVPAGDDHWNATMTDAQVSELRTARAQQGLSYSALAKRFGISKSHAHSICTGRRRAPGGSNGFLVTRAKKVKR